MEALKKMKMKINLKVGLVFAGMLVFTNSCKEDFLTVAPNGALSANVLATAKGVDALLIGAYSMLDGVASNGFGWEAASSNWVYGSIRGMEANKGTDAGDQPDINPIQVYAEASTNPYLNIKWRSIYDGIARSNSALVVLAEAEAAGAVTTAEADSFRKQARALRGYFHLEAFRLWGKADGTGIPYVDETTNTAEVTNDVDVRDLIIADLDAGTTLADNMGQIGRFNGTVAKVLKAKAMMQLKGDYTGAKPILQGVIGSAIAPAPGATWTGTKPNGASIGLEPNYGAIFDAATRNTSLESVYTVQYSVNDGSAGWNAGWGEVLNFPYKSGASPGGCCGFFQPTQEFVNSFRTSGGLPMARTAYNTNPDIRDDGITGGSIWEDDREYAKNAGVTVYNPVNPFTDLGYVSLIDDNLGNDPLTSPAAWQLVWTEDNSREVDPRLDWTVGRRGIPYLDWGVHTGSDWIRDQSYAGPYVPKKQVYKKSQEGQLTEVGNWTSGYTANGYRLIRAADVVLLLAECQIETGEVSNGVANINRIRERASNPASFVKESDGTTNAATYVINQYGALGLPEARTALRMERKLELGMEGHRYFDLNRWGITVTELNEILAYEKTRRSSLYGSAVVGPEDVNFPIPQQQLDLMPGRLQQNR